MILTRYYLFLYVAEREIRIAFFFSPSFFSFLVLQVNDLNSTSGESAFGEGGMGGRMKTKEVSSDLHLMNHPLPIFHFFLEGTHPRESSYIIS